MVKCLMTWSWKGKNAAEVTERFRKWEPIGNVKFYYPIHSVLGANKAFTIVEVDDAQTMAKNLNTWTDICTYKISPIIDSKELVSME